MLCHRTFDGASNGMFERLPQVVGKADSHELDGSGSETEDASNDPLDDECRDRVNAAITSGAPPNGRALK